MYRRTNDLEMGQELYTLSCMLHTHVNGMITETRRLSWMDGSDSDDEDQHSSDYASDESVSIQLWSVYPLFIV
jgi:hypothetical protein